MTDRVDQPTDPPTDQPTSQTTSGQPDEKAPPSITTIDGEQIAHNPRAEAIWVTSVIGGLALLIALAIWR